MKIHTRYHGQIDISEQEILYFQNGIPGFPDEEQFIILALPNQDLFSVLQSIGTADLAFIITNPFYFIDNYQFKLDQATIDQLEIETDVGISVLGIVTVHEPFEKTTANLQAPIVINTKNNLAKQVILNDSIYKIKHPLFGQSVKG
ncbi:flagellar assembly protein FliW [Heyndrickxia sp. FSL K6-6286]|uniref:flagellar assembly protein FliW n=1 Tax=Heyndrickxia sp. FSL K6-6286 TaxID=2921510 RepID=UPI00217F191F|nr:flagellar assembly protein FliW [Heyndrickxia oleronia]